MSRQVDLDYDHGRDVTEHTTHIPPECASIEYPLVERLLSLYTTSADNPLRGSRECLFDRWQNGHDGSRCAKAQKTSSWVRSYSDWVL
jgi:hypothetical protein